MKKQMKKQMEEDANAQPETKKIIELNDSERALIEAQRQEGERMEAFKLGYQELVQRTGFAWGIDGNSPLNNPKLGIGKVN